jgi:hypothetical protein
MQWEVLPHPAYSPDLAPWDFQPFSPLKEALGGERFKADDEVKLSEQRWLDDLPQTLFKRALKEVPVRWQGCAEVQGECRNIGNTFKKL